MTLTEFTISEVEGLKSYASLAEAKRYLVVNLVRWPAWMALSESEQQRLLVAATARLDLLRYVGEKEDKDQETQWPRKSTNVDGADGVIPSALVQAVSILAGSLATDPTQGESSAQFSNEKRVQADVAVIEFFRPEKGEALQDRTAYRLLQNAGLLGGLPSAQRGYVSRGNFKDGSCGKARPSTYSRAIKGGGGDGVPVEDWAKLGTSIEIPADKLSNAPRRTVIRDDTLDGSGKEDDPLRVVRAVPEGGGAGQVLRRTSEGYQWAGSSYMVLGRRDNIWVRAGTDMTRQQRTNIFVDDATLEDSDILIFLFSTNDSTGQVNATMTGNEWKKIVESSGSFPSIDHYREFNGIRVGRTTSNEVEVRVDISKIDTNHSVYNIFVAKLATAADGQVPLVSPWAIDDNMEQIPEDKLANAPQANIVEFDRRIAPWAQRGSADQIPRDKLDNADGDGLTRAEVDDRIRAGVFDWAEEGNTELIPTEKIGDALDNRIIEWAREGSTDAIPADRLANAPATAVVSDTTLSGSGVAGDALSVANAIPEGGTSGQVLARTANGYEWTDAPAGMNIGGGGLFGTSTGNRNINKVSGSGRGRAYEVDITMDDASIDDDSQIIVLMRQELANGVPYTTEVRFTGKEWNALPEATPNEQLDDNTEGDHYIEFGTGNRGAQVNGRVGRTTNNKLWINLPSAAPDNQRFTISAGTLSGPVPGGDETPDLATWAQAGNNDKIPRAKLPAIETLSLGTDLPAPDNSDFPKLYGTGLEEGTGNDARIETQALHYLKHRDANTARMYVGRIDDNVFGYANGQGGVLSPEGLAPEFITSFITELDGETWNIYATAVVTSASPFSNEAMFRFQWRTFGEQSWNSVTLNRQPDQESEAEFVTYKGPDMQANPWLQDAELEVEFRSQTGTNVNLDIFSSDVFVDIVDRDILEHTEARVLTKLADNKASFDNRLARVETPTRTLMGTWERSASGETSSTQELASAIPADQESFVFYTLENVGDIVQKRASESVYTAAGTNLVDVSKLRRWVRAPGTGDNNRFKWRKEQVGFNIYLLRLTDLDDNILEERLMSLEYRPNFLNDDHQPFEGVFISQTCDALTSTIGALVTMDSKRLKVWGLKL